MELVTIDEFRKIDLRVAKIIAAERIHGSDKLIRLELDLGDPSTSSGQDPSANSINAQAVRGSEESSGSRRSGEQSRTASSGQEKRQVVAGIGTAYTPEELVGREIAIVANLTPRTLVGVESRGMLLAASDEQGEPVILTVEKHVAPGAKIT
ncbi:MAG: hypothetical protein A3A43_02705 [Candidatus Liptonbacteria bacterium RIFCSPLOWO2_01_FULL_56_20]|uniref:tRNA-binding domain-containing protein n=1 Tax=Candidatus Liptonbacteria bacterium RIFCSPLOWO2_01_FULL_56_20 TaxID=1798652 RepID=A0A1G2CH76_9BACT|nr:MAG: hypothetical protein UY96_C0009G0005 [Parcubacteria group bacterium GW2011_GWB1_56_8]OGY97548.1 MAG: hypothetical protein A2681_00630 [Candidatus Liptonbacteria bacterium RIFCSPHIGHO2_01_FULL_56_18b]OGZ00764.1 MAG: hypothetical protein A3A43_02705 [Candidatus Liptonbacteria bacterium RIFCSPLOWO2_01_FULL_56_20]